jgi:quercetin dioxygenase-like cupin family protein
MGEIQYQIGGQVYPLKAGDSLLFEATQPHCFWNRGESPAQVLLIFQAVEGGYLARQRHLEG